ncbi:UvrD-helicase domain-containing protein [Eggerthella timonensis]|uniref:UvrD-helicase domain-containing protein n=1 Tax=Eggerthella timonensis TaxID=1871008 RepID=UPI0011AF46D3|nr:UvrD-helicase domain-containing protein [Eggerthella timonensis]
MIDTIASFEGRIAKVQGPARSGKTEALVRRCARLVGSGVAPASILVEVSSAAATQALRARLRGALGPDERHAADEMHVRTPLETCVAVLDAPAGRAATGRVPRLLNGAEYNFFLEDMKTLGQPIRRLRKMLEFFYRQMSDLAPRDSWLMGGEEEAVLAHLERVLASRGAMLAQEAPYRCASFLQSDAGEGARGGYAFVLCDDFQNMSRAEQTCLCLLADRQLVVCGNPNQQHATNDAFPCVEGFVQFDERRRGVEAFALTGAFGNPSITALVDSLCDHGDMDPSFKAGSASGEGAMSDVMAVKWSTPEDELDGITKFLRVMLDGEEDLHEGRTCVLAPTKCWALMAQRVLKQRGFDVALTGAFCNLGGDPREIARSRALVAYTKLNLLADPFDMTAWRSWCGFGNYLTNSDAWNGLLTFADKRGLTLHDALALTAELDEEPFARAGALAERWREGQALIAAHGARKGFDLLRAIEADGLPEFEQTARTLVGDEDAAAVFALQRRNVADPALPDDPHVLHVSPYGSLTGLEYDNVFAIAAVDGLMPQRDAFELISTEEERERIMNEERRSFCNSVSKANKRLVVSYFSKAPLELAERSKMQVVRVRAEGSDRVAAVRPTSFLAEAGNDAPSTTGGQTLLAQHGLN